jgi:phosphoribosylamine--glycine ligase
MGAFCPVSFYNNELKEEIEKEIIIPTLQGIQQEKMNYKGVIYFGLMITAQGPRLLEYNVRLGDPETEVVLPALKSDLAELVLSCFNGTLAQFNMKFYDDTFIDVVLVSGGYPLNYRKGYKITGLPELSQDVLTFHAGTKLVKNNLLTNGGRVINVVVKEKNLEKAIKKVYNECVKIYFQDLYFRKDIGKREVNFIK